MKAKAVTDRAIDAAIERGKRLDKIEPRARAAHYDQATDRIVIDLVGGASLSVPRRLLQGVQNGTPQDYADVTVEGKGSGLHWERLDADLLVAGIVLGIFGSRRWMSALGRAGGRVKSLAKAAASRRNGARGGRPPRSASREL